MHAWGSIPCLRVLAKPLPPPIRSLFTASNPRFYKDSYYYAHLLQSRPGPESLRQTHAQIIAAGHGRNPFLAAKLVSRYSDLGAPGVEDARRVFDRAPHRDIVLWNVMIRGYANSGPPIDAVALYDQMRCSTAAAPSNCYTYSFVLKACSALGNDRIGRAVHSHATRSGLDFDLFVSNALVAFYAKHREIEAARTVFDGIPVRDIVSWNSMIAGYGQNDRAADAILLFRRMLLDAAANKPDRVTLVALLPACAALAAAHEGMWIHCYIAKTGMIVDTVLASGLIGMYGSCGRLEDAHKVFDKIPGTDLVVCNSMIRAYGMHGRAPEALEIFSKMVEMGVRPDGICFVCVLSACSHAGMVDKGREIFESMDGYNVEKSQIHYACMVDILGRSGELKRAVEFIESMPVEPGGDVWGALLGACRIYNEVGIAEEAAKRLFILDPENAGRYAALANMYEDAGRPEDASRVRKAMRDRGVRKAMGCSMVEVDCEFHTFGVEDESHPMTNEIYGVLELLHFDFHDSLKMCRIRDEFRFPVIV